MSHRPSSPRPSATPKQFAWHTEGSSAEPWVLSSSPLNIPSGSLVAVIGGTGQGKSSLLSAVLGDMPCTTHTEDDARSIRGSVAYVPQTSWIFNGTIRDNITFGLPYDQERFHHGKEDKEGQRRTQKKKRRGNLTC